MLAGPVHTHVALSLAAFGLTVLLSVSDLLATAHIRATKLS